MSEYYRGGSYVPDTTVNAGVPTSGTISLSDFYGASQIYSVDYSLGYGSSVVNSGGVNFFHYGYANGATFTPPPSNMGTLTPTLFNGITIKGMYDTLVNTLKFRTLELLGNHAGTIPFDTFTINGFTLNESAASTRGVVYGGNTVWSWSMSSILTSGTYSANLTKN